MSGKKWVLLVAGSEGWRNYQHQANVCCAYQIIKKYGIPDKQIVVMMYDDIAYNADNPYKGKIISVIKELENVYPAVPKDYTGKDVTPENFLAALQGDDSKGRKVIKSGGDDEIFVYMSGLGCQGGFNFPEMSLTASDLVEAINNMAANKQFSKMVLYMDSDYSGSMLNTLSSIKKVYAVTSCDKTNTNIPDDADSTLKVSLSDQFSSALLKFIYSNNFSAAILKELFGFICKNIKHPPCQFGNTKINECTLSDFLQN